MAPPVGRFVVVIIDIVPEFVVVSDSEEGKDEPIDDSSAEILVIVIVVPDIEFDSPLTASAVKFDEDLAIELDSC